MTVKTDMPGGRGASALGAWLTAEVAETAMQARSALMAAMSKDASKLTILRGGARHTLSVDFKKLMESGWNKMGGKLDPASR